MQAQSKNAEQDLSEDVLEHALSAYGQRARRGGRSKEDFWLHSGSRRPGLCWWRCDGRDSAQHNRRFVLSANHKSRQLRI